METSRAYVHTYFSSLLFLMSRHYIILAYEVDDHYYRLFLSYYVLCVVVL